MGQFRFAGCAPSLTRGPTGRLAVVDVPCDLVAESGGRRQYRIDGTLNRASLTGRTMLVGCDGFAFGVSKAVPSSARLRIGDDVDVVLREAPR